MLKAILKRLADLLLPLLVEEIKELLTKEKQTDGKESDTVLRESD